MNASSNIVVNIFIYFCLKKDNYDFKMLFYGSAMFYYFKSFGDLLPK